MIEPAGLRVAQATAALQAIDRGAQLLGVPLAGVLVTLIGTSRVLWIDAATFAVSAALVAVAIPATHARDRVATSPRYLANLLEGVRFVAHHRLMRAVLLTVMVTNFLGSPLPTVVLPVYARRVLGSAVDLGLMVGAYGGGSLIGAIVFGAVGHKLARRPTFVTTFIVVALLSWALTALPPLAIAAGALALRGAAAGPINPILGAIKYERVLAALRGRVFGVLTAGSYAAVPLGVGLTGYLIDASGLRPTLILQAACYLVVTLSLLFAGAFRDMDTPVEAATEPVGRGEAPLEKSGQHVADR